MTFDNIWGLPLSLSRGRNISELIERHWQSESVIEDYHCSKCQKLLDCTRTFEFFRLPEVIVIQLKRFEYGRFNKRKINDEIKIEKELNLSNFLNEEAKKTIKNGKYTLSGIIHHSG